MPRAPNARKVREDILLELATLIAERQSLKSVFRAFAERLLSGTAFDFASLTILDAVREQYITVAAYPEDAITEEAQMVFSVDDMHPRALLRIPDGAEYAPRDSGVRAGMLLESYGIRRAWTMPLIRGDDVLGVLTVARFTRSRFSETEQGFLRQAGRLLASAVRDETRVHEARQEAARSRLITELSLVLNEEEPVAALFDRIHTLLSEALQTDFAMLGEVRPENALHVVRSAPPLPEQACARLVAESSELIGGAAAPQVFTSSENVPGTGWPAILEDLGFRQCVAQTLQHGSAALGVLVLGRKARRPFNATDRQFVELVGGLLSQALALEQRYDAKLAELEEQRVVASIMSVAAQEGEPGALLRAIQQPLAHMVPEPVVFFGFLEEDRITFVLPDGASLTREFAIEGDQAVYMRVPQELRDAMPIRRLGIRATSVSVARAAGAMIGYLVIGSADPHYQFGGDQLRVFRLVAQLIGPALRAAREWAVAERERSLLRLAFGSLSEGIILVDQDLRPAYYNELGRILVAADGDEESPRREWDPDLPKEVSIKLRTTALYGHPARGRTNVYIGGEERWFDYEFLPIDHAEYRLMCVIRDASEAVALEQREQHHREEMEQGARLAALGALVGGVAHELNNPLTAILGFSELLTKTLPPGAATEDLAVIQREAERAKHIVADLLSIGRPTPMEPSEFSLQSVVGHVERVRRAVWAERNIDVKIELEEAAIHAWGSEDRIIQVLVNLLANAEDAVQGREAPTIKIRVYQDGAYAVVEVHDNGIGMEEATRRHIFEPFFTTKQGTGTGLGLSLSYSIIAAHEGQMDVESAPGQGSCFRVRLPSRAGPAQEAAPVPVKLHKASRRLQVLVIDDEPSLRKVCQRLVQALGHDCQVADDPGSAAELAARHDFDLVLCDYRLSNRYADEVIEAFNRINPELVQRTVLATGAMNDDGVQALLARHNLRLLPKPYGAEDLSVLLGELDAAA